MGPLYLSLYRHTYSETFSSINNQNLPFFFHMQKHILKSYISTFANMINFSRSTLLIFLFISLLFLVAFIQSGHGKSSTQNHKKQLHSISRKKKSAPPPPQLPSNNNNGNNAGVFNAVSFGAVGDGVTDDTQAVKKAWDAACQSHTSAVLLLPQKYCFIIQTSIFSGPCQNDQLIFQVIN